MHAQHIWHELAKTCWMQLLCIPTQERHHKVIRSHVVDTDNTVGLEKSLAEELLLHSLRDLKQQLMRDGFIDPHKRSASLAQKLQSAFGCSGENVLTCVRARSGATTLNSGDVAIYSFDGVDILAGDIILFASATEWGECAFLTAWTRAADRKHGFWKFAITDDVVRVPVRMLIASTAAFIGERTATSVCPPALNVL